MDAESPIPQQWWDQDAAAVVSQKHHQQHAVFGSTTPVPMERVNVSNNPAYYMSDPVNGHMNHPPNSTGPPTFYQHLHRPGTPSQSAQQFPSSYQQVNTLSSPYHSYPRRPASTEPTIHSRPASVELPYRPGSVEPPIRAVSAEPMHETMPKPQPPSSTGLIRLTLRKPMGIVFEPMTDSSGAQRGVRICDLPRTGAAALSRKLEVGDELLSINDRTMSRLTFDEIMDFIIEADPERVNLLFRRPRKELLGSKSTSGGSVLSLTGTAQSNTVKWADDQESKHRDRNHRNNERRERGRDRDRTVSERMKQAANNMSKKRRPRKEKDEPWASENFLDMLIDSLCSPLVNDNCKQNDEDSEFEDDETYFSKDDSTYVTYESVEISKGKARPRASQKSKHKDSRRDDDSTIDNDTLEDDSYMERRTKNDVRNGKTAFRQKAARDKDRMAVNEIPYEDDGTLETLDSIERNFLKKQFNKRSKEAKKPNHALDLAAAPIKELEYDDQADNADVSVMTPSLVDTYISNTALSFGRHNYSPHEPGLTVDESIQKSPQRFYRHVVQHLLETHEPEKVRLLDKLMAKYTGREEHLIQKLTLRYNRQGKMGDKKVPTINEEESFKDQNTEETEKMLPQASVGTTKELTYASSVAHTDSLASFVTNNNNNHHFADAANNAKLRFSAKQESEDIKNITAIDNENNNFDEIINKELTEDETETEPKKFFDTCFNSQNQVVRNINSISKQDAVQPEIPKQEEFKEEPETLLYVEKNVDDDVPNHNSTTSGKEVQSHNYDEVEDEGHEVEIDTAEENSYSGDSAYSGSSSLDGTSPAVIAQISELLNFVYGKTTVPGQIDRVSTIMRAYEGRESVLLELLETKALIKANEQSEQQQMLAQQQVTSPLSMSAPSVAVGGEFVGREMHDDMSSVSGASFKINMKNFSDPASSPNEVGETQETLQRSKSQPGGSSRKQQDAKKSSNRTSSESRKQKPEKKKLFSFAIFRGKKSKKKSGGAFPSDEPKKSKNKKDGLIRVDSGERSI